MTTPSPNPATNQQEAPVTSPTIEVPEEVRPPAYVVAPRVQRLTGYLAAPVVLAVAAGVAAVVRAVAP